MSERLKRLRKENGLKIKEVAEYLGVTMRTISRYEDGTREPSIENIKKLCKLYDVTSDYLIGIKEDD